MNSIYASFKPTLLSLLMGDGMPGGAVLVAVGVNESYVFDTAHLDTTDIPLESIVAGPTQLASVTRDGALLDAADLDFDSVTVGEVCKAVIVFFAWETESALLAHIDTTVDNSLPQNILTGQLRIRWNPTGICRI